MYVGTMVFTPSSTNVLRSCSMIPTSIPISFG
jgi:hypothetical protein